MQELTITEIELINGGTSASQVCYFVAGVAACFVNPIVAVPFFILSFDYS